MHRIVITKQSVVLIYFARVTLFVWMGGSAPVLTLFRV